MRRDTQTRRQQPRVLDLRRWLAGCVLLWINLAISGGAYGQSGADPWGALGQSAPYNLPMKTLGGTQFWTDVRSTSGWRVQLNSETGHYRLLDAKNIRRAWGSLTVCQQAFEERMKRGEIVPARGEVVILLHGLIRAPGSMQALEKHFQQQGFATVNFGYGSGRGSVADHAAALDSVIRQLGSEVRSIDFIGHSLGNLVVRRYLHDQTIRSTGRQGDPRIRRIVMLGPPNQGSRMARLMRSSLSFHAVTGESGGELALGWEKLEPTLAIPKMPFGIIAGGQPPGAWSNVLLPGPDDMTVSVEETKLPGAADFLVAPLLHTTMMNQPEVFEAATRFFRHGYFRESGKRQPIPLRPQGGPAIGARPTGTR